MTTDFLALGTRWTRPRTFSLYEIFFQAPPESPDSRAPRELFVGGSSGAPRQETVGASAYAGLSSRSTARRYGLGTETTQSKRFPGFFRARPAPRLNHPSRLARALCADDCLRRSTP
jgi:hypothetical protein